MADKKSGADLFIVDNSDADWKVRDYLREWCEIAHQFDIATGSFEIGGLLDLDEHWQKLDKIRILMGDEVSKRTKRAFVESIERVKHVLDDSIEREKETNDFLKGVAAIVEGMTAGKIESRVYRKDKFHAKAYITHGKHAVVGSSALVGSSNFTHPGLTGNVELNVQIQREVEELQAWYERHWNDAEDITAGVLKVIERHIREYTPFEVYAKALQEYFRGHVMSPEAWEKTESRVFPILDKYQQDGYLSLLKIARQHNGAFLCDGVGLGKTFVGMMLIERLAEFDRKRVALFVPKAARKPVWEAAINKYLPHLHGDFSNLVVYNHTDLSRGNDFIARFARLSEMADVIIIDEAHHFRNPGFVGSDDRRPSRYRQMFEIADGKTMYMLTATPVNNKLIDLQHMIELFSRRQSDYFKRTLGINSLAGHFRTMEKALERKLLPADAEVDGGMETNEVEAEEVLTGDHLFRGLVVQRSRAYVRRSQEQQDGFRAIFPEREAPQVAHYSVKKTYGKLLDIMEKAFSKDKPLFALPIYYPLAYYKGDDESIDTKLENRQKQVVGLIRVQFLKRFESSASAFKLSCVNLLGKLLAFVQKNCHTEHDQKHFERWKLQNADILGYAHEQTDLFEPDDDDDDDDSDLVTEELLEAAEQLSEKDYKVDEILQETYLDLSQIIEFLRELEKFKPKHDDKLNALIKLLKTDPVMKKHKVLIFTEYLHTARYLKKHLQDAGIDAVDEVDSKTDRDRGQIIRQFSPYYNDSSSAELEAKGLSETRILIATDVLSEGLNLQDATRLINYDLHWNPVRLMQRIGRVDRRMNPDIEANLLADHPDPQDVRGKVAFWNFLPPEELDNLLRLYTLVSHKTLRISKTFGIEGKKLLTPEDDYEALKDFTHQLNGEETSEELMRLEYQKLLKDYPDLEERLNDLPGRVFSAKAHPSGSARGVFFCYALPAYDTTRAELGQDDASAWTEEAGNTAWYYYDLEHDTIHGDTAEIAGIIRSTPDTPRRRVMADDELSAIRKKMDKHIKNDYLKRSQAPIGVKPALKAWMELN